MESYLEAEILSNTGKWQSWQPKQNGIPPNVKTLNMWTGRNDKIIPLRQWKKRKICIKPHIFQHPCTKEEEK